ncbi:MAG TPA: hypothetical protein PK344_16645 [Syntrophorhabdaceae bacterium]|nr:hypothetical protein [Syntrophorhabdaceae bacterium]
MENTEKEIIYYGTLVFLVSLIVVLVPSGYDPGELWWHLKAGEWTVQHGFVAADPFAHTTTGAWLNYNWLAEVLFYYGYTHAGINWLYTFSFFFIGGNICALVYITCFYRSRCIASAILITLLVTQCTYMIALKPHVFSFLFAAWFAFVIYLSKPSSRLIWTLPVLQVVWANMHVMFVFGWLAGLILVAKAVESKQEIKQPCLVLALLLAAPLINPYGYAIYPELFSLFRYGFEELPVIVKALRLPEFMPPGTSWGGYVLYVVTATLVLVFNRKRVSFVDAGAFALLLVLSMSQAKYIPYFAIFTAGIVAGYMPEAFTDAFANRKRLSTKAAFAAMLCVSLLLGFRFAAFLKHSPDMNAAPVQEAMALKAAGNPPRTGNMLNVLDDGRYLMHELHPQYRTFIDARLHLFSREVVSDYLKIMRGHRDALRIIEKYDVDTVVLPKDLVLVETLKTEKGWRVIYEGAKRTVLVERLVGSSDHPASVRDER